MKRLALVLFACSLVGCASATVKPLKAEYVTGDASSSLKSEKIVDELKRGKNQYGYYFIEVYPYTKTLVETQANERGLKNMDSKEKIRTEISGSMDAFVNKTTCFVFEVWTHSLESSKFTQWKAKVENDTGTLTDVAFTNISGVNSVPAPMHNSPTGYTWLNMSGGCVPKIDVTRGFKIHAIPQLQQDAPKVILEWTAPTKSASN